MPVSPWINTAQSDGATISISSTTAWNFRLDPIKSAIAIVFFLYRCVFCCQVARREQIAVWRLNLLEIALATSLNPYKMRLTGTAASRFGWMSSSHSWHVPQLPSSMRSWLNSRSIARARGECAVVSSSGSARCLSLVQRLPLNELWIYSPLGPTLDGDFAPTKWRCPGTHFEGNEYPLTGWCQLLLWVSNVDTLPSKKTSVDRPGARPDQGKSSCQGCQHNMSQRICRL